MKYKRAVTIPKHAHPLVREAFKLIRDNDLVVADIAHKAGVSANLPYDWRTRYSPYIPDFEAFLNAMGYKLTITKVEDGT